MQEIVNVRIDDRLIHGQVAAVWSLVTKATRIMVVDDLVVKDPVNKEALKMACPQQCKLSILTVAKAAGVSDRGNENTHRDSEPGQLL